MEAALKSVVVSDLRARGFRGSFPHLRRLLENRIDLLTFQFYSSGGSFVVEVTNCRPDGVLTGGRVVEPKKATAHDVIPRIRLGSDKASGRSDHWFVFGKPNYQNGHDHVHPSAHYERIAIAVRELVDSQAEQIWANWAPSN